VEIKSLWDFNKVMLDIGPYAWPGGYPCYFLCADGEALSYKAAEENAGLIRDALITNDRNSGWFVVAYEVNWEDTELMCSHTNEFIESAYGERDESN
jgi:hypothetical protein